MDSVSETYRQLLVRRRARLFAQEVKDSDGYALRVPDELIDWLTDEEVLTFHHLLREYGLVRRPDMRWEKA